MLIKSALAHFLGLTSSISLSLGFFTGFFSFVAYSTDKWICDMFCQEYRKWVWPSILLIVFGMMGVAAAKIADHQSEA